MIEGDNFKKMFESMKAQKKLACLELNLNDTEI